MWRRILFTIALCGLILITAMSLPVLGSRPAKLPERGHAAQQSPLPTPTATPSLAVVQSQPDPWSSWFNTNEIILEFEGVVDQQAIAQRLTIEPDLEYDLYWEGQTLRILRKGPMTPGVEYRLSIAQMADRRPVGGEGLDFALTFSAPRVLAYVEGATPNYDPNQIVLGFGYSMDRESVEKALRITPLAPGMFQWSDDNMRLTVTADEALRPETTYHVSFEGILREQNGGELPADDPQQFTTNSAILNGDPNLYHQVSPTQPVRLEFDRPMDWESVAAAISMQPVLPLDIWWEENVLLVQPLRGYFDENRDYLFTLGTGALDAAGQAILLKPYTRTVYMTQFERVANFGYGPNMQILDLDGRRAIQYQGQNELRMLDAALYQMTMPQLLDRYASGFRGVAGWDAAPIAHEGLSLVEQWQVELEEPPSQQDAPALRELFLPDEAPAGFYLLEIGNEPAKDQLIVLLTQNVITLKEGDGQLFAWVTDIQGGSVADALVSIYARDGELIAQGHSDASGIFKTSIARDPQPLIVLAQVGDDVTAAGFSNEWRSNGNQWWGWWNPRPTPQAYAIHTYTDRPIYRPNQTVFYKSILRKDEDAQISLPAEGISATVRIRDARNNVVQTQTSAANAFGTLHGEFALAEGAMLGNYVVEVMVGDHIQRQIFKVEEYRKPDYEVQVQLLGADSGVRPGFVQGELMTAVVNVRYLFGEPVANAKLEMKQYWMQPTPWWYETNGEPSWYPLYEEPITGTTDANGRFTFSIPIAPIQNYWQSDGQSSLQQTLLGVEVTADDGSHQTVTGLATTPVYNAAEAIHVEPLDYVQQPQQPFSVHMTVNTFGSEPTPNREIMLTLVQFEWDAQTGSNEKILQEHIMRTDPAGTVNAELMLYEPGYYELRATGKDARQNDMSYRTWFYVAAENDSWYYRDQQALRIAVAQPEYAVGETARFIIESKMSGSALLTFERGTTRRQEIVQLTAPLTIIERTMQADDAPNIFVSINAWQPQAIDLTTQSWQSQPEARLYVAETEVQVPVEGKRLSIEIAPDRDHFGPRQDVTFTIQVADGQGAPLQAELSLALVDEAIFLLSDELAGPIFDAYYGPRPHYVQTYDGLALQRYFGGGGGGGGEGSPVSPRSNFPDTALWLPAVQTDANGHATVTLTLPDTLTSWRLTAKAVTADDTLVGETFINFETQQSVVVRPILPASLTAGDKTMLSALVHNYSDAALTLDVWLESPLTVHGALTHTIELTAGAVQVVGWPLQAVEVGAFAVTVRARPHTAESVSTGADANSYTDAVQLPLNVQPLAVADVQTLTGQLDAENPEFATELVLPENALPQSVVTVELNRSIAGSLLTGLEYLTGYPYGCVEQTMSRALPNAVVGRAFHQLGIGNPTIQADLPALINAGVQRLYGFQHNDGGWGWWFDDNSDAYQTAWVLFGLSATAEAGHEVDAEVMRRGAAWLANAKTFDQLDLTTEAFSLYSLALVQAHLQSDGFVSAQSDEKTLIDLRVQAHNMATRFAELDAFSQAALALALHNLGEIEQAQAMLQILADTAVADEGLIHWSGASEDGHYHAKTMSSDVRSTALALSAFVEIAPGHAYEPNIVDWLMAQRDVQGWGTTNETAFTILALTDHLLAAQGDANDTTYVLYLNEQEIAQGKLDRQAPTFTVQIPAGELQRGANQLRLVQQRGADANAAEDSSSGFIYYVIQQRTLVGEAEIEPRGVVQVQRRYLDPASRQPLSSVTAGRLVEVELTVQLPDTAFYLIVEDELPGGLEALNERLNTSSRVQPYAGEPSFFWAEYGYNHKEIRDNKVSFFITQMDSGVRSFRYMARALHSGSFVAMPAQAYAMYDLTTWGRSGSNLLEVVEGIH